ncbi:hypothetical protein DIPPA_07921 [Diplonema papillatum]|nr:hypothetical protein DIPPA_07921 [Diplonema papillatum]
MSKKRRPDTSLCGLVQSDALSAGQWTELTQVLQRTDASNTEAALQAKLDRLSMLKRNLSPTEYLSSVVLWSMVARREPSVVSEQYTDVVVTLTLKMCDGSMRACEPFQDAAYPLLSAALKNCICACLVSLRGILPYGPRGAASYRFLTELAWFLNAGNPEENAGPEANPEPSSYSEPLDVIGIDGAAVLSWRRILFASPDVQRNAELVLHQSRRARTPGLKHSPAPLSTEERDELIQLFAEGVPATEARPLLGAKCVPLSSPLEDFSEPKTRGGVLGTWVCEDGALVIEVGADDGQPRVVGVVNKRVVGSGEAVLAVSLRWGPDACLRVDQVAERVVRVRLERVNGMAIQERTSYAFSSKHTGCAHWRYTARLLTLSLTQSPDPSETASVFKAALGGSSSLVPHVERLLRHTTLQSAHPESAAVLAHAALNPTEEWVDWDAFVGASPGCWCYNAVCFLLQYFDTGNRHTVNASFVDALRSAARTIKDPVSHDPWATLSTLIGATYSEADGTWSCLPNLSALAHEAIAGSKQQPTYLFDAFTVSGFHVTLEHPLLKAWTVVNTTLLDRAYAVSVVHSVTGVAFRIELAAVACNDNRKTARMRVMLVPSHVHAHGNRTSLDVTTGRYRSTACPRDQKCSDGASTAVEQGGQQVPIAPNGHGKCTRCSTRDGDTDSLLDCESIAASPTKPPPDSTNRCMPQDLASHATQSPGGFLSGVHAAANYGNTCVFEGEIRCKNTPSAAESARGTGALRFSRALGRCVPVLADFFTVAAVQGYECVPSMFACAARLVEYVVPETMGALAGGVQGSLLRLWDTACARLMQRGSFASARDLDAWITADTHALSLATGLRFVFANALLECYSTSRPSLIASRSALLEPIDTRLLQPVCSLYPSVRAVVAQARLAASEVTCRYRECRVSARLNDSLVPLRGLHEANGASFDCARFVAVWKEQVADLTSVLRVLRSLVQIQSVPAALPAFTDVTACWENRTTIDLCDIARTVAAAKFALGPLAPAPDIALSLLVASHTTEQSSASCPKVKGENGHGNRNTFESATMLALCVSTARLEEIENSCHGDVGDACAAAGNPLSMCTDTSELPESRLDSSLQSMHTAESLESCDDSNTGDDRSCSPVNSRRAAIPLPGGPLEGKQSFWTELHDACKTFDNVVGVEGALHEFSADTEGTEGIKGVVQSRGTSPCIPARQLQPGGSGWDLDVPSSARNARVDLPETFDGESCQQQQRQQQQQEQELASHRLSLGRLSLLTPPQVSQAIASMRALRSKSSWVSPTATPRARSDHTPSDWRPGVNVGDSVMKHSPKGPKPGRNAHVLEPSLSSAGHCGDEMRGPLVTEAWEEVCAEQSPLPVHEGTRPVPTVLALYPGRDSEDSGSNRESPAASVRLRGLCGLDGDYLLSVWTYAKESSDGERVLLAHEGGAWLVVSEGTAHVNTAASPPTPPGQLASNLEDWPIQPQNTAASVSLHDEVLLRGVGCTDGRIVEPLDMGDCVEEGRHHANLMIRVKRAPGCAPVVDSRVVDAFCRTGDSDARAQSDAQNHSGDSRSLSLPEAAVGVTGTARCAPDSRSEAACLFLGDSTTHGGQEVPWLPGIVETTLAFKKPFELVRGDELFRSQGGSLFFRNVPPESPCAAVGIEPGAQVLAVGEYRNAPACAATDSAAMLTLLKAQMAAVAREPCRGITIRLPWYWWPGTPDVLFSANGASATKTGGARHSVCIALAPASLKSWKVRLAGAVVGCRVGLCERDYDVTKPCDSAENAAKAYWLTRSGVLRHGASSVAAAGVPFRAGDVVSVEHTDAHEIVFYINHVKLAQKFTGVRDASWRAAVCLAQKTACAEIAAGLPVFDVTCWRQPSRPLRFVDGSPPGRESASVQIEKGCAAAVGQTVFRGSGPHHYAVRVALEHVNDAKGVQVGVMPVCVSPDPTRTRGDTGTFFGFTVRLDGAVFGHDQFRVVSQQPSPLHGSDLTVVLGFDLNLHTGLVRVTRNGTSYCTSTLVADDLTPYIGPLVPYCMLSSPGVTVTLLSAADEKLAYSLQRQAAHRRSPGASDLSLLPSAVVVAVPHEAGVSGRLSRARGLYSPVSPTFLREDGRYCLSHVRGRWVVADRGGSRLAWSTECRPEALRNGPGLLWFGTGGCNDSLPAAVRLACDGLPAPLVLRLCSAGRCLYSDGTFTLVRLRSLRLWAVFTGERRHSAPTDTALYISPCCTDAVIPPHGAATWLRGDGNSWVPDASVKIGPVFSNRQKAARSTVYPVPAIALVSNCPSAAGLPTREELRVYHILRPILRDPTHWSIPTATQQLRRVVNRVGGVTPEQGQGMHWKEQEMANAAGRKCALQGFVDQLCAVLSAADSHVKIARRLSSVSTSDHPTDLDAETVCPAVSVSSRQIDGPTDVHGGLRVVQRPVFGAESGAAGKKYCRKICDPGFVDISDLPKSDQRLVAMATACSVGEGPCCYWDCSLHPPGALSAWLQGVVDCFTEAPSGIARDSIIVLGSQDLSVEDQRWLVRAMRELPVFAFVTAPTTHGPTDSVGVAQTLSADWRSAAISRVIDARKFAKCTVFASKPGGGKSYGAEKLLREQWAHVEPTRLDLDGTSSCEGACESLLAAFARSDVGVLVVHVAHDCPDDLANRVLNGLLFLGSVAADSGVTATVPGDRKWHILVEVQLPSSHADLEVDVQRCQFAAASTCLVGAVGSGALAQSSPVAMGNGTSGQDTADVINRRVVAATVGDKKGVEDTEPAYEVSALPPATGVCRLLDIATWPGACEVADVLPFDSAEHAEFLEKSAPFFGHDAAAANLKSLQAAISEGTEQDEGQPPDHAQVALALRFLARKYEAYSKIDFGRTENDRDRDLRVKDFTTAVLHEARHLARASSGSGGRDHVHLFLHTGDGSQSSAARTVLLKGEAPTDLLPTRHAAYPLTQNLKKSIPNHYPVFAQHLSTEFEVSLPDVWSSLQHSKALPAFSLSLLSEIVTLNARIDLGEPLIFSSPSQLACFRLITHLRGLPRLRPPTSQTSCFLDVRKALFRFLLPHFPRREALVRAFNRTEKVKLVECLDALSRSMPAAKGEEAGEVCKSLADLVASTVSDDGGGGDPVLLRLKRDAPEFRSQLDDLLLRLGQLRARSVSGGNSAPPVDAPLAGAPSALSDVRRLLLEPSLCLTHELVMRCLRQILSKVSIQVANLAVEDTLETDDFAQAVCEWLLHGFQHTPVGERVHLTRQLTRLLVPLADSPFVAAPPGLIARLRTAASLPEATSPSDLAHMVEGMLSAPRRSNRYTASVSSGGAPRDILAELLPVFTLAESFPDATFFVVCRADGSATVAPGWLRRIVRDKIWLLYGECCPASGGRLPRNVCLAAVVGGTDSSGGSALGLDCEGTEAKVDRPAT